MPMYMLLNAFAIQLGTTKEQPGNYQGPQLYNPVYCHRYSLYIVLSLEHGIPSDQVEDGGIRLCSIRLCGIGACGIRLAPGSLDCNLIR